MQTVYTVTFVNKSHGADVLTHAHTFSELFTSYDSAVIAISAITCELPENMRLVCYADQHTYFRSDPGNNDRWIVRPHTAPGESK